MSKHRSATQVTIAATEEKSTFARFVERYWKPAALALALFSAFLIYRQNTTSRARRTVHQAWDSASSRLALGFSGIDFQQPAHTGGLPSEVVGTAAEPWGLLAQASALIEDGDFDSARSTLQSLQARFPDHAINRDQYPSPSIGGKEDEQVHLLSLPGKLLASIDEMQRWERENPQLVGNPDLAAGSPRVRLQTDAGEIEVGLYADRAPKHAENFLKLVREGYYDGTRFHRVLKGQIIQGGDPESKNDDTLAWGTGGPGYKIDEELTGLSHFEGVLAAARTGGDTQSSGSQFYITVRPMHQFDDSYVVFGKVTAGLDIAKKIASGELAQGSDRPVTPIKLLSATIIEG